MIKTTRDASSQQEHNVAKSLGGHVSSNSGATPFAKADVFVGDFLIECKTKMTECKSFTVQKQWLSTLRQERREMGKTASALAISFDVGKTNYYIIDEALFKRLLEAMKE